MMDISAAVIPLVDYLFLGVGRFGVIDEYLLGQVRLTSSLLNCPCWIPGSGQKHGVGMCPIDGLLYC